MIFNTPFSSTHFLNRLRNSTPILCVLTLVTTLNLGSISANNYFFADDWGWFYRSKFSDFSNFPILPTQLYNDRPVGEIVLRFLFTLFDFNYVSIHYVIFSIHLLNVYLIYKFISMYQRKEISLFICLLFGIWYPSNFAIGWIAAIFDLICSTFILGSIYAFMKYAEKGEKKYLLFTLILQILAIRSKEFGILTPVFILGFLLLNNRYKLSKVYREVIIIFGTSIFFGSIYLYLLLNNKASSSDSYSTALDWEAIVANLRNYYSILFFRDETISLILLLPIVVSFLLYRKLKLLRNGLIYVVLFIVSLSPVLMLPNQFSEIYLYFPHFFAILAFCDHLNFVRKGVALPLVLCIAITLFQPLSQAHNLRLIDYEKFAISRDQFDKFVKLESNKKPVKRYFIVGVTPYLNPYSYGPGSSIRLLHRDPSIEIFLELPYGTLLEEFCKDPISSRFYEYTNRTLTDVTQRIKTTCPVVER